MIYEMTESKKIKRTIQPQKCNSGSAWTKPESEETRTDAKQQNKPTEKTRLSVGLRCGGQF